MDLKQKLQDSDAWLFWTGLVLGLAAIGVISLLLFAVAYVANNFPGFLLGFVVLFASLGLGRVLLDVFFDV